MAFLAVLILNVGAAAGDYAAARKELVDEITRDGRRVSLSTGIRGFDARVLAAIGNVPRHQFVPMLLRPAAYANRPLPIGHGQTISQPYIVALMTDLLELQAGQQVLEIGTGSGYQTAVLAELGVRVHSIEIIEALANSARAHLAETGYSGVVVRWADGYHGWPERAPFDAIIVTAAASHIPPPLVAQLKPGGRMVIPVGARFAVQQLVLVQKAADGGVSTRQLLPVAFVPLRRRR
jgi:protein-L-isoaspartate(D-aspartate) O-methyltransferase